MSLLTNEENEEHSPKKLLGSTHLGTAHLLGEALGVVHGGGATDVLPAVPGYLLVEGRVGLCGLVGLLELPVDRAPYSDVNDQCASMVVLRCTFDTHPRLLR